MEDNNVKDVWSDEEIESLQTYTDNLLQQDTTRFLQWYLWYNAAYRENGDADVLPASTTNLNKLIFDEADKVAVACDSDGCIELCVVDQGENVYATLYHQESKIAGICEDALEDYYAGLRTYSETV